MGSRSTLLFIGPKEDRSILEVTPCHVLHRLFFVVYNLSGNETEREKKRDERCIARLMCSYKKDMLQL